MANKQAKIYSQNVVIEDEGLLDQGRAAKNRVVLDQRLTYSRKITEIPTFYVPVEPDAQYLTFWVKGNHVGHTLRDLSTFDNEILCNNNKHWCIVDSGGLDVGYMGNYHGVPSSPCWALDGNVDSAQVTDNARIRVKASTVGISLTAWVKISDFTQHRTTNRRIMAKTDDTTNAYCLFVTSTNKAVFAVKYNNIEYKVETPATLVTGTWYFIAATFKSTATIEARIYLNGTVSTTAFAGTMVYPPYNTNLNLFTNGEDGYDDFGDFSGYCRDLRIWKEKILTQQEITNFNTNRNTISNIPFGSVMIAGFTWTAPDTGISSFTSTSFTDTSFTT